MLEELYNLSPAPSGSLEPADPPGLSRIGGASRCEALRAGYTPVKYAPVK